MGDRGQYFEISFGCRGWTGIAQQGEPSSEWRGICGCSRCDFSWQILLLASARRRRGGRDEWSRPSANTQARASGVRKANSENCILSWRQTCTNTLIAAATAVTCDTGIPLVLALSPRHLLSQPTLPTSPLKSHLSTCFLPRVGPTAICLLPSLYSSLSHVQSFSGRAVPSYALCLIMSLSRSPSAPPR